MRKILAVLVIAILGVVAAWISAGRAAGPKIVIASPTVVGQTGRLDVTIETPGAALTRLAVTLKQEDAAVPLFSLGDDAAQLSREGDNTLHLSQPLGKERIPGLKNGTATLEVAASRPVLFGYREAASTSTQEIEVRLTPPRASVLSRFHFVNHGGSEMVVYRVTPPEAVSGVRVGEFEFPGYPAAGAGIDTHDAALRVAFFALQWNQDPNTPITVFARDAYGNESTAPFEYRVFPKEFKHSTIQVDDPFLARVVPPILANSPELKVDDPSDLLASYVKINRDLRRMNAETIAKLAEQTAPEILWRGPFKQLVNTAVEAGFADQRTYLYMGKDIDHEVHLGFDLASIAGAPVLAANRGRVVHAGWLGIYGNCVILDHGMGLQSLYAHLSSIDVSVGDMVDTEQRLGRTGSTGLAGGDHLHFTMLLAGHAITPIDWWSAQWVEDRITRKLREAGAPE
jgi:hypothetical protein